jgi:ribosomal protein S18 acetylase RimI-like enzyme
MVEIGPFHPANYDEVMALWRTTEGLTLRDADSRKGISLYLSRNPGLSFVARDESALVGAVLAGTDGRRGYLQHLAVAPTHRGQGIGRALAERVMDAFAAVGVLKVHLIVRRENVKARAFWEHLGWTAREEVMLMSHTDSTGPNA